MSQPQSENEDAQVGEENFVDYSEENLIRYYNAKGYSYKEIIQFLNIKHEVNISYRTLRRRCKNYGISSRGENFENAFKRINELINGCYKGNGYRTIWHKLKLEGISVPRAFVECAMKEIDPEGAKERKGKTLKRREYRNPGANFAWHLDGYDKLKPHGFPIHGAIDGFSRKILWLYVTRSNNSPDRILKFYMKAVAQYGGCPVELITDLGTENGIVASVQSYFRNSVNAHRYVPSPRNQRIESWWSQLSKQRSKWWRNYFSNLESEISYNIASDLYKEAVWFIYSPIIQKDLDLLKENWNTHYIRRSRFDTIAGKPDLLYTIPQQNGGVECIQRVEPDEIRYIKNNIEIDIDDCSDYTDYFRYVLEEASVQNPSSVFEAENVLKILMRAGENGLQVDH